MEQEIVVPTVWPILWQLLNSPIGMLVVSSLLAGVAGWFFKREPKWERLFNEYRGVFIEAVKWAEEQIPDDAEVPALKKMDQALKFVINVRGTGLDKVKQVDLRKAIEAAHKQLEEKKK